MTAPDPSTTATCSTRTASEKDVQNASSIIHSTSESQCCGSNEQYHFCENWLSGCAGSLPNKALPGLNKVINTTTLTPLEREFFISFVPAELEDPTALMNAVRSEGFRTESCTGRRHVNTTWAFRQRQTSPGFSWVPEASISEASTAYKISQSKQRSMRDIFTAFPTGVEGLDAVAHQLEDYICHQMAQLSEEDVSIIDLASN